MKERLIQLLDMEHLTPSKFADLIGVQRSSVSHILSGRNKPSFDFLQKTLKAFPGLKADWLMLGAGPMYEHMGREPGNLFDQNSESSENKGSEAEESIEYTDQRLSEVKNDSSDIPVNPLTEELEKSNAGSESATQDRKLIQVMLFYDDDTFTTYKPSQ